MAYKPADLASNAGAGAYTKARQSNFWIPRTTVGSLNDVKSVNFAVNPDRLKFEWVVEASGRLSLGLRLRVCGFRVPWSDAQPLQWLSLTRLDHGL